MYKRTFLFHTASTTLKYNGQVINTRTKHNAFAVNVVLSSTVVLQGKSGTFAILSDVAE